MEDVDKIIISSIRDIGCDISEDIQILNQCTLEQIVKMAVLCLKTIKPEISLRTELRQSVSARFNMCGKIAHECSELGYKGEVGFQTFLYFNESEIRKVFMFLVENILRAEKSTIVTEAVEEDSIVSIPTNISRAVRSMLNIGADAVVNDGQNHSTTIPFISYPLETGILTPGQKINCSPKEWKEFVTNELPFVNDQIRKLDNLLPSVITLNAKGIIQPLQVKSSTNSYRIRPNDIVDNVGTIEVPLIANSTGDDDHLYKLSSKHVYNFNSKEKEEILVNNKTYSTCAKLEKMLKLNEQEEEEEDGKEMEELVLELDSLKDQLSELNQKLLGATKIYSAKKEELVVDSDEENAMNVALQFLPESDNTIPKLKESNEKIRSKVEMHSTLWTERKAFLQQKCARLKHECDAKTEQKTQLINQISDLYLEIRSVTDRYHNKIHTNERLKQYRNFMKGGTTRIEYTARILEIIESIKKQGKEIDKILSDTRVLQKEITNLEDRIEWLFIIVDKRIVDHINYGDDDDFSADIYGDYMNVYKSYYDTLKMDAEINAINKEIKDYEEQIQDLSSSVTTEAMEQVTSDVHKLKMEQIYLEEQLQSLVD